VLLRNSRISAGLTKEAKSLVPASWLAKLWHGAKAKPGATTWIERGMGAVGGKGGLVEQAQAAIKKHEGVGPALKAWRPKSLTGQAARWAGLNPMGAAGIGVGTAIAGGAGVEAAKGLSLTPPGPEALMMRQMQGFQ